MCKYEAGTIKPLGVPEPVEGPPKGEIFLKGYMYILKCSDKSYYVGSTDNLTLRVEEHNAGEGCTYTQERGFN